MKTNLDTAQTLMIESNNVPHLRQMTLGEVIAAIEARGITMERSISGYWRAMRGREIFWDDSASDEAYDELSAIIAVYRLIESRKFVVYYCNSIESKEMEIFETLEEAQKFCEEEIKGYEPAIERDDNDLCDVFQLEVYDVSTFEEVSGYGDAVYSTGYYWEE